MIPVLQHELCVRHKLLPEREFLDYVAISQSLPGVVAVNMSMMVGRRFAGVWGAALAALAMALPAFVSIMLFLTLLSAYRTHPVVHGALGGVKAAAAAIIFVTAVKMWRNVVVRPWMAAVAVVSFFAIVAGNVNVVWVILCSGALGLAIHAWHIRRNALAHVPAPPAPDEDADPELDIPLAERLDDLTDLTAEPPSGILHRHYHGTNKEEGK